MNDNVVKGAVLATALAVSGGIGAAISSTVTVKPSTTMTNGCVCQVNSSANPGDKFCGGDVGLKVSCECAKGVTATGISVVCGK